MKLLLLMTILNDGTKELLKDLINQEKKKFIFMIII